MILKTKGRYFTLLEVLVVMMILSLMVIVTGVKVQEAYKEQRFLSESQQVLNQLELAQDLMLLLDADVRVVLKMNTNDQLTLKLDVEKPFSDSWLKLIERPLVFPSIQSYEFKDNEFGSPKDETILHFVFGNMTQGTLILFDQKQPSRTNKKMKKTIISLPGYPVPIGKSKKLNRMVNERISPSLYPEEVYEKLYSNRKNDIKTK